MSINLGKVGVDAVLEQATVMFGAKDRINAGGAVSGHAKASHPPRHALHHPIAFFACPLAPPKCLVATA